MDVSIIIADQSNEEEHSKVVQEFGGYEDIAIINIPSLCSGFSVDYVFRNMDIKTTYTATLDCDAFPLHKNWLLLPITLIEEYNLSFVGGLFFESRKEEAVHCYHNNPFYCMSQCYRVGTTEMYKTLSMQGGFTRFHARKKTVFSYGDNTWDGWAAEDYANRGSDDGTIAHFYEDNFLQNNKVSLATTHTMGNTKNGDSGYGGIIDGMVLHFAFSHWSQGIEDRVAKDYAYWKNRINEGDENVLEEMVAVAMKNPSDPYHEQGTHVRGFWDGTEKKSYPSSPGLNKRIEELKQNDFKSKAL